MEKLPQEIVDKVSSYLNRSDLKNVLLLSRKLQHAAERASGAFAFFDFAAHTPEERQSFLAKFGGHRFRYLRNICITTRFTPLQHSHWSESRSGDESEPRKREPRQREPSPPPESCRESAEELKRKDQSFRSQIGDVWEAIHMAESRQQDSTGRLQLLILTPMRWVDDQSCDHRRYSSWRVHLSSALQLQELQSVRALSICNPVYEDNQDGSSHSKLDLRAIVDLASRCPNLEYLGCKLGVDEWVDSADPWLQHFMHDFPGCRRDTRNDFASSLNGNPLPATLQHIQLDFINEIRLSVEEQQRPMPNLVLPNEHDLFSSSLRLLSHQLRRMDLHLIADETLFWPREYDASPTWPNLEILSVLFHMCSPSGKWYFQSPLGYGRNDKGYEINDDSIYPPLEDHEDDMEWCHESMDGTPNSSPTFRVVPIDDELTPLLTAFAKATRNMPKLLEAWLWTPLSFHPFGMPEQDDDVFSRMYPEGDLAWGIMYSAPGAPIPNNENFTTARQLNWRVGPWRPDPELHALFLEIGEEQHGTILEETWHDDGQEDSLVSQEWFWGGTICPAGAEPNPYPSYF